MRLPMTFRGLGALALAFAGLPIGGAFAAEMGQSPYLKGYRDKLMGVLPPEPGLYLRNDVIYYSADVDRTVLNGIVELELEVEMFYEIPALSVVTGLEILGGQYAFGVLPTIMNTDITLLAAGGGAIAGRKDEKLALGDTVIMPFMLGWHGGEAHLNFGVGVLAPTGDYDTDDVAHTSLNYWAIIPQLGYTWFDPRSGWDVSVGLAYTFPFENEATDYQSGQIFHVDASVTRTLGSVSVGAVGYAMVQVTGDSGAGAALGDYKSRVFAVGPIVSYSAPLGRTEATFIAKWNHEFAAENALEGDAFTVAAIIPF